MSDNIESTGPVCGCCGLAYTSRAEGRFGDIRITGKIWPVCGDCITAMWQARAWGHRPDEPGQPAAEGTQS